MRRALLCGAALALTATLAACGGDAGGGDETTLEVTWWGNTTRHEATEQAIDGVDPVSWTSVKRPRGLRW